MAQIQRDLVKLLEDLDRRARPGRPSRYRAIQKYVFITDTVGLATDSVTSTVLEVPMVWVGAATASSCALAWGFGQWA